MAAPRCSPPETRAQDSAFMRQCSFAGLRPQLPLRWPTPPGVPDSPKKQYRSYYVYLGYTDLSDVLSWQHLSSFDLVLRLVDFGSLRPVLVWLLGWTSTRGQVPLDPISMFLFISWRIVNGWTRAQALYNLQHPRYIVTLSRFGRVASPASLVYNPCSQKVDHSEPLRVGIDPCRFMSTYARRATHASKS